ncbi:kielin/chordin-like protein [Octopus bimaculoides]|uniref:kielin/chordin-like protein n=1 Tax=Octopus bimaculoides TaxID=37653 RepID=UPI0022E98D00|nr:kielin/chordin-like protein [Octopus bimaculoides]
MARDKCNKCSCKSKGKVKCTEKICPSTTTPETTTQKNVTSEKCHYNGEIYILGQTFMAKDQCNQCGCMIKGKVECTLKKCTPITTPETTIQTDDTSVECRYQQKVYMFGDIFIAVDKCNKCSCKSKGKVECTKKKCPPSTTPETTPKKIEIYFKCYYNGEIHLFGDVFIAVDDCNKCSCKSKGKVECTKKKCPPSTTPETTLKKIEIYFKCYYNGDVHVFGDVFIAVDKCNKCSCKSKGKVECTKKKCPPSTTPETTSKKDDTSSKCYYHAEIHLFGDIFLAVDKCNKCSCKSKGKVECTKKKCPPSTTPETTTSSKCYYNGKMYILGQIFVAVDKCNQCSCKFKGKVECTERKCSSTTAVGATLKNDTSSKCKYNGQVYIAGQVFVAVDKCNQCSCKPKGEVDCTKKTCPSSVTPEPTIQVTGFSVKCYYNGQIYIFGQIFLAVDKCNNCSCQSNRKVECSEKKCPPSTTPETTKQNNETSKTCSYNGQVYMFGQIFMSSDKCNKCSCKSKEKVECSEKKCSLPITPATPVNETSVKCHYHGQMYVFGQIFTAVDKCNNCSCESKGKVECTEKKCIPSTTPETSTQMKHNYFLCHYHGEVHVIGQTFTAGDKCNTCTCKSKGTITCTERKCSQGKSQGTPINRSC